MKKEKAIPIHIAKLIIGYLQNTLTEKEHLELDDWVGISDDHLEIFEQLCERNDDHVFDADALIMETDELLDYWMIAGLVARQMQNIISEDEKVILQSWIDASEEHKALYERFTNKANLQKFVAAFKQWLAQSAQRPDWN